MSVGDILFWGFIIKTPLGSLVIKLVDTVSIITNKCVDMILTIDGDSHDFLAGMYFFECHFII